MIWLHCGDYTQVQTTLSLTNRLIETSDQDEVMVTCETAQLAAFDGLPAQTLRTQAPPETPARCRSFLDDHKPHSLIWIGGTLRPTLLRHVEKLGLSATLINARTNGLFPGGTGWLPRSTRNAVAAFGRILTADGVTATRLTRGGVPAHRIEATGPILEEPLPLPHNKYELTVMAEALGNRPVWLAANITRDEVADMAAAHMSAARKNHRLMMVLTPRNTRDGAKAADVLRGAGFKVALRSEGEDPEPEQQVYIADLPDELGMWYRIIPLTFMGGTMRGGGTASPLEPILLGSAIIHGTQKSPQQARFERLAAAQASREVRSAKELGIAVSVLISPEQSARMALAGWDEITQNAQTVNSLVDAALDHAGHGEGSP